MQWAVLALAGFALYFGVVEPGADVLTRMHGESDLAEKRLKELRERADTRAKAVDTLSRNARLYGGVLPPGPSDERVSAASQRISRVLSDNDARDVDFSSRQPTDLGRDALAGFLEDADANVVRRVIFDVSFEATPERAMAIITALERVPEITMIESVSIDRRDTRGLRLLSVTLSPEVWVVERKAGRL